MSFTERTATVFFVLMMAFGTLSTGGDSLVVEPVFDPEESGTLVCVDEAEREDQLMVSDGSGGAIIAWMDERSGNYHIYAQRVDPYGDMLWEKNGKMVSSEVGSQNDFDIIEDGHGGIFVVWHDGTIEYNGIYCQRVDKNGNLLWNENGVGIGNEEGAEIYPILVSDGTGGILASWADRRSGVYDIYAQRIDGEGSILWAENGTVVCDATGTQNRPYMVTDGSGGAIIIWEDGRAGNTDIYAQRIDKDGVSLWTENGIPMCTESSNQNTATIATDGAEGAIISWVDFRNGNRDLYSQRVNGSGEVQWTSDGVPVCVASGNQFNRFSVPDDEGGAFIIWRDYRNGNNDVYAQRIDKDGVPLWTDDGIPVCNADGHQYPGSAIRDWGDGILIAWDDSRGTSTDMYLQRVDGYGVSLWEENGKVFCQNDKDQDDPVMVMDSKNGIFVSWLDERYYLTSVYVDRIGTLIETGEPAYTVDEDAIYSFDLSSNDDLNVTWSIVEAPSWLSLDPATGLLSGTPDNGDVGAHTVTVKATDDIGIWDELTFELTVMNTDPMIFDTGRPGNVLEGSTYYYDHNCSDAGTITWSMKTSGDWLSFNTSSGEIHGTPDNDDVGTIWVMISVNDGNGGTGFDIFEIEVIDKNDHPSILTGYLLDAVEDEYYISSIEWEDIDGDTLMNWSLETNAFWLSINSSTGILSGTPDNDDVGDVWANISLQDLRGGIDHVNLSFAVLNVNDVPVISRVDPDDAVEGQPYALRMEGSDIDPTGDRLTWGILTETWLSMNASTGNLSGTPAEEDVGENRVVISLSDGSVSTTVELIITVIDVNSDPNIADFAVPEIKEGETFFFILEALDPDDEELNWTITSDADWMEFDLDNGIMYGIAEEGTYSIEVEVKDGRGGSDTVEFDIKVGPADREGTSFLNTALCVLSPIILGLAVIMALLMLVLARKKDKGPKEE